MNIEQLITSINDFSNKRDWHRFHSIKNLAMALSVEVAELVEIYQWISEEESNNLSNNILREKTSDELADIFVYLLQISSKLNIDLEQAVFEKIKKNELKYPVDKSKGNATKYSDFENE